jgi:hypothetical protein
MTKVKNLFDSLNEFLSRIRAAKEAKPDYEVCFNMLISNDFPWVKSPLQVRINRLISDPDLAWMPLIEIIHSKDIKRLSEFANALLQEEVYLSKSPDFLRNFTLTHGFVAYVEEFKNKERGKFRVKALEDRAEELLSNFEFDKANELFSAESAFFDHDWHEDKRAFYKKKEQDIECLQNKIEKLLIKFEFDKADTLFFAEESLLKTEWYEGKRGIYKKKEQDIECLQNKIEELLIKFEFDKANKLFFAEKSLLNTEWYESKRSFCKEKEQDIKFFKNNAQELLAKFEFDKADKLFSEERYFLGSAWDEWYTRTRAVHMNRKFHEKKQHGDFLIQGHIYPKFNPVELKSTRRSAGSESAKKQKNKTQSPVINVDEKKTSLKREMKNPVLNNSKGVKSCDALSTELLVVRKKCLNLSETLKKELEGKEDKYKEELNELHYLSEMMIDFTGRLTRKVESQKWLNDAENILIRIISSILKSEKGASKLVKVLVAKAGAAAAVGGVGGLIATYGAASTGTAIVTLSGAAEGTAVLYWLGSLVGLGTAAGTIMTGGIGLLGGYVAYRMLNNRPRSMDDLSKEEKIIVTTCASLIKTVKDAQESNEIITKEKGDFLDKEVLGPLMNNLKSYKSSAAEKALGNKYLEKLDSSIDDFCMLLNRLRSW